VYCDFRNPEDLALTPDDRFLLVTGFSALPDTFLTEMALFDTGTSSRVPLNVSLAEPIWGDSDCARTSLDFSPHGLDFIARADGAYQLAITNHLPTETIEFFEVVPENGSWALVWRGCVTAPVNSLFNDVALTRAGNFYATEMYKADLPFDSLLAAGASAASTGSVWHWQRDDGYAELAGTAGSFPNGIALSDDEKVIES